MKLPMPLLLRGDARRLPLPDESVDLIVTSPPYFGLRSYTDGGEHYTGQVGSEATPAEFLAALLDCTREMVRVLKPTGSIWVNLGDKYAGSGSGPARTGIRPDGSTRGPGAAAEGRQGRLPVTDVRSKSLMLIPERYRIACVDDLGLIARAVTIWSKPNGLPESVTDRVRRSHEDWVHLTRQSRYYSAVDEIREAHAGEFLASGVRNPRHGRPGGQMPIRAAGIGEGRDAALGRETAANNFTAPLNPLGKLPGSVWEIATQPLHVPPELGVDHFAAFPMEWPRRLILGWSPREVCVGCGEGRRPVAERAHVEPNQRLALQTVARSAGTGGTARSTLGRDASAAERTITGYACACPDTTASTTPGVVCDPFGGTGTTALVATMLGRHGISVDLSADYNRLAHWRASDPKERARAAGLDPDLVAKLRPELPGQDSLFDEATA